MYDEGHLRRYLLGELNEEEQQAVEEALLRDGELFDSLLAAEDELIDAYVEGALSSMERKSFEQRFLSAAERQRKLSFAMALRRYVTTETSSVVSRPLSVVRPRSSMVGHPSVWWKQAFANQYLRMAAAAVMVIGLGLGIWRVFFYQSEVAKGMAALAKAYRVERPVEARISGLGYAPLNITRGAEQPKVDELQLDLAERILLEQVAEHPSAAAHHALGRLYLAERKFDRAIALFDEALKIDPDNAQLHCDYGAVLLEMGKADRLSDDSGKGLEELARSLEHLNKALELNGSLLEALFNRALVRQEMVLTEQAEEDWRKYLEKDPSSKWADEARQHLKELEERRTKTSQSREELFQGFVSAYQAGDDGKAWKALSQSRARTGNLITERLLDAYLALAAQGQSVQAYEKLRMLSYAGELETQNVGDRFTSDLARFYKLIGSTQIETLAEARSLMKSASQNFTQSEFDNAATCYSKARRLFDQSSDVCESLFAENWLGNCLLRIPKTAQSLAIFERLSQTFEDKKYRWLHAQSLNAISDAQSSVDAISKALDHASRSMQVSEEIQDDAGVLRNLQQLVSMQLKLGEYHESLRFSARAFDLSGTFYPTPKQIWGCYHDAALDLYWLGFLDAAVELEKEALGLAIESGEPLLRSRSYERLGLIYEKVHNFDEAIRNGHLAQEEGQHIEGQSSKLNIIAHSSLRLGYLYQRIGDMNRALENYNQAIRLYEKLGFNIYLYEAHKGKLQCFVSVGDVSAAKEELKIALTLFEQYRPKILEEGNRNSFFDAGQGIYDIAADLAFSKMNDRKLAFEYSEACRARSLLDLTHTEAELVEGKVGVDITIPSLTQPLDLLEIQRRIPARAQILQYAVLEDKILMWVVSKYGIQGKEELIASDDLGQRVLAYVESISSPSGNDPEEPGSRAKQLYNVLIGPVESFLDKQSELCIVPDKVLNYLPFGSLVSPRSGKYFIEDYVFEVSPSSSIFISCSEAARKKERLSREVLLSVGGPHFDRSKFPTLPDLTSAGKEAEQVAACYQASVALTGDRATRSRVNSGIMRADVAHLASHYVVDAKSPLSSKLLLTKERTQNANDSDGVLQAYEIYKMKLPRMRLVVLSACQTAIERAYRGEGAISIARPFISAQVPIVVGSLWPVDSNSTADLMIRFHKHRKQEGLPTVEALRNAQLEMMARSEQWHQPYFWASFVVIGGYAKF